MGLKITSDVKISPQELAILFCEMSDDEQAEVFQHIGKIADSWSAIGGEMQWYHLGRKLLEQGVKTPGWKFAADIGAFTMLHSYRYFEKTMGVQI